jgi:predicted transposase YdaD
MLNLLTSIEDTSGYQAIKELGIAEGEAKGKAEGKAEDLTRLLTRRFGPLPAWTTARISAAPIAQLDAWLDGILDAPSLTDLIGPECGAPH